MKKKEADYWFLYIFHRTFENVDVVDGNSMCQCVRVCVCVSEARERENMEKGRGGGRGVIIY